MKNYAIRAAVALAIAALFSCNPYNKIQKNEDATNALKAGWVADWVRHNPCPPGNEINLDSVCKLIWYGLRDTGVTWPHERIDTELSVDTSAEFQKLHMDFYILQGNYIKLYKQYGILKNQLDKQGTQYILKPVEDLRRIQLLSDTVDALNLRLSHLQGNQTAKADDCTQAVKDANKRTNKWLWLFVAACVVIAGYLAVKVYSLVSGGWLTKIKL